MNFSILFHLIKAYKDFKNQSGFSLIELIVVSAIIVTISGIAMINYTQFNQRIILEQGASDLKERIIEAKNKAFTGEKDCTICAVGTCGDGNDKTLDSWRIDGLNNNGNTYYIIASCRGTNFGRINYQLPSPLIFESIYPVDVDGDRNIVFTALANSPENTRTIILLNPVNNKRAIIDVSSTGEVNITYP